MLEFDAISAVGHELSPCVDIVLRWGTKIYEWTLTGSLGFKFICIKASSGEKSLSGFFSILSNSNGTFQFILTCHDWGCCNITGTSVILTRKNGK